MSLSYLRSPPGARSGYKYFPLCDGGGGGGAGKIRKTTFGSDPAVRHGHAWVRAACAKVFLGETGVIRLPHLQAIGKDGLVHGGTQLIIRNGISRFRMEGGQIKSGPVWGSRHGSSPHPLSGTRAGTTPPPPPICERPCVDGRAGQGAGGAVPLLSPGEGPRPCGPRGCSCGRGGQGGVLGDVGLQQRCAWIPIGGEGRSWVLGGKGNFVRQKVWGHS